MDWGIALGVIGVLGIPLALAILGLTMAATSPGEFRFVRGCFVAAAIISMATVLLLQWNYQEGSPTMRAFIVAAVAAIIFGSISVAFDWVNKKQAPEAAETNAGELLLECQLAPLPEVGLPNQNVFLKIDPFRFTDLGTIGFGTTPSEPGKPFKWPEEWKNRTQSSARCRVTNYSKTTLFNLEIPFKMDFVLLERGENPNSVVGNKIINTADGMLPITKLEPGSEGAYVFYIHNQGRDIVRPEFANSATCLPLGGSNRISVKVIQPADRMSHPHAIWPVREATDIVNGVDSSKSSPALLPPVPLPPNRQGRK